MQELSRQEELGKLQEELDQKEEAEEILWLTPLLLLLPLLSGCHWRRAWRWGAVHARRWLSNRRRGGGGVCARTRARWLWAACVVSRYQLRLKQGKERYMQAVAKWSKKERSQEMIRRVRRRKMQLEDLERTLEGSASASASSWGLGGEPEGRPHESDFVPRRRHSLHNTADPEEVRATVPLWLLISRGAPHLGPITLLHPGVPQAASPPRASQPALPQPQADRGEGGDRSHYPVKRLR
jgi:hypothetical protein